MKNIYKERKKELIEKVGDKQIYSEVYYFAQIDLIRKLLGIMSKKAVVNKKDLLYMLSCVNRLDLDKRTLDIIDRTVKFEVFEQNRY